MAAGVRYRRAARSDSGTLIERVAVTGAAGVVGQFVLDALAASKQLVTAHARSWQNHLPAASHLKFVEGDLADQSVRASTVQDAQALVHCAFSHLPGRYRGGEGDDPAGFWRANVEGTVALLEDARKAGVQRVVLLSSRAALTGRTYDQPHACGDEQPARPEGHYGVVKVAMEALASGLSAPGFSVSALRATGIYGLRNPITRSKWFDLVRSSVVDRRDPEPRVATEVHGADVASAITCLLGAEPTNVHGRTFNCSDLVVSNRRVADYCQRLAADSAAQLQRSVDAHERFPGLILTCAGLNALGWQPGGVPRLEGTLRALVAEALRSQ